MVARALSQSAWLALLLLLTVPALRAADQDVIAYSGRIDAYPKTFTGDCRVRFLLLDRNNSRIWKSDEMLVAAVNGAYTTRLTLDEKLAKHPEYKLRVEFADCVHARPEVTADVPLGFVMLAASGAPIDDDAIAAAAGPPGTGNVAWTGSSHNLAGQHAAEKPPHAGTSAAPSAPFLPSTDAPAIAAVTPPLMTPKYGVHRRSNGSALTVTAIPEVGTNLLVPHISYADGTAQTVFKAVATGGTPPYTYQWSFRGNGVYDTSVLNSSNGDLHATKVFPAGNFDEYLTAGVKVTDSAGATVTTSYPFRLYSAANVNDDIKGDKSVDDALWYLHRNLVRSTVNGVPIAGINEGGSDYQLAGTAVAIQSYQNLGHKLSVDPTADPYVNDLIQMHNYVLNSLVDVGISMQAHGDPDVLGTGIGFNTNPGGNFYIPSLCCVALATSGASDRVVPTGLPHAGRDYAFVCQSIVDWLAWAQNDYGSGEGGFSYNANSGGLDGSQHHMVAMALKYAESQMSCTIPGFVRSEFALAVDALIDPTTGATGYSNRSWLNVAKTGGNLTSFCFLGDTSSSARVVKAEKYLADHWNDNNFQYSNLGDFYAMYAVMKGSRSFVPFIDTFTTTDGQTTIDWYSQYRTYLLSHQDSSGIYHGNNNLWPFADSHPAMQTAMGSEIIEFVFLSAPPVAVASADSRNIPPFSTVNLHQDQSYHLDAARTMVSFDWDFQQNGQFTDYHSTNINDAIPFTAGAAGTYTVRVKVTDDVGQTSVSAPLTIVASNSNHAPVAKAVPDGHGYPLASYIFDKSVGTLTLDGTASYDPDAAQGDSIAAYAWDIDGDGIYGDVMGVTGVLTTATLPSAWTTPGTYTITLKCTDDASWSGPDASLSGYANASIYVCEHSVTATAQSLIGNQNTNIPIVVRGWTARSTTLTATLQSLPSNGVLYATPDGTTLGAAFNIGDTLSGAQMRAIFVPAANDYGSPYATFDFTVNDGVMDSLAASVTINVNRTPIVAALTGGTINEGSAYTEDGSFTDTDSNQTWTATVDFGDGHGAQSLTLSNHAFNLNHTYVDNGTYTVTVSVTDNYGATNSKQTTVHVQNVNPAIGQLSAAAINENDVATLTGAIIEPGLLDTLTLNVDWGDNSNPTTYNYAAGTNAFSVTHRYLDNPATGNTFTIHATLTDKDGGVGNANTQITVRNVNPTAQLINPPATGTEGTAITLTGSGADVSTIDAQSLTYSWSVLKNNSAFASGSGTSFSFTPNHSGTYQATLTVTDKDGGSGTAQTTMTIGNLPPVIATANLHLDSNIIIEGGQAVLTGTFIDPGTADTHTVSINWGDGSANGSVSLGAGVTSFGPLNHTYFRTNANVSNLITATVTDDDGASCSANTTIYVLNIAPIASITGAPAISPEGTALTLHGTVTDLTPNQTFSYLWTVEKNGVAYTFGTNVDFNFTPDSPGAYLVKLSVTDAGGGIGTDYFLVTATNVAPTAAIVGTPVNAVEDSVISLTSNVSDPGTADTFTYAWAVTKNAASFASGNAAAFTFLPDDNGTYAVTLTVTDQSGGQSVDTKIIQVVNVPPTASILGAPAHGMEGNAIHLLAQATDVSPVDTLAGFTYAWTVSLNGVTVQTAETPELNFTPISGIYMVALTVTDKDGGQGMTTQQIEVGNIPPVVAIAGAFPVNPEGAAITLNALVSDLNPQAAFTYAWTAKRNGLTVATGSGANFDFTPDRAGNYTVSLTVTDSDGASGSAVVNLNVAAVKPLVTIAGAPSEVNAGTAVALTSTVVEPGSGEGLAYAWTVLNGDLIPVASGARPNFTFTPTDGSVYTVKLVVTTDAGASGSAQVLFTCHAPAQIMSGITADHNPALPMQMVRFSSAAVSQEQLTWHWDFGDGVTADVASGSHQYAYVGTYTVNLTLTTAAGLKTQASLDVVVDANGGQPVAPGEELDSDGSGVPDTIKTALAGISSMNQYDLKNKPVELTGIIAQQTMKVSKMGVKLSFQKKNSDTITLMGTLPIPHGVDPVKQRLALDVGGIVKVFSLDAKGSATNKNGDQFRLSLKRANGVVIEQTARFTATFKAGDFQSQLGALGFTGTLPTKSAQRQLSVMVLFDGALYKTMQTLMYTTNGSVGAGKSV